MGGSRTGLGVLVLSLFLGPSACNDHSLRPFEKAYPGFGHTRFAVQPIPKVDLVFVVDNSPGSATLQSALSRGVGPLVDYLDERAGRVDVRVAVVPSAAGHDSCEVSPAELGAPRLSSCLDHLDRFSAEEAWACTEHCHHSGEELGFNASVGPWVDARDWKGDRAPGLADVLACALPLGTAGCELSSPLEAAQRLMLRTQVPDDPAYGLIRPDSQIMFVFVTDDVECSGNVGNASTLGGGAGCWNAGVRCEANMSGLDCFAVDLDEAGVVVADHEDAVLLPVTHYLDFFEELDFDRRDEFPWIGIRASAIVGVDAKVGRPVYDDTPGDNFMDDYGVAAGCVDTRADPDALLVPPPVRMAEFVDEMDGSLMSVCEPNYGLALIGAANRALEGTERPCLRRCYADEDPLTPGRQLDCIVSVVEGTHEWQLQECERDEAGAYLRDENGAFIVPPGEFDTCFRLLTDADGTTPSPDDDLDPACIAGEPAISVAFELRPGTVPRDGIRASVSCVESHDCDQ